MKTMRKLIYGELLWAIGFVALAFLALFAFFDLIEELPALGQRSPFDPALEYGLWQALLYVALQLPSHLYELLPIAVLIGAVFGLVRLAQSSEFTILRTSGLGPGLALRQMLVLGMAFAALTFVLGDYVAPWSDRQAQQLKATFEGQIRLGQTGAWLKERGAQRQVSVNVAALEGPNDLRGVRLFEFDADGRITRTLSAERATVVPERGLWQLHQVQLHQFDTQADPPRLQVQQLPSLDWPTGLSADMVSVALLRPERMSAWGLYQYIEHLQANNQATQRYEIELWRKLFFPLSCVVMVVLALPFAYLHFRSKGLAAYVFVGVMLGLSFVLLSNMFVYIGNLLAWRPWLAAAAPALLYSAASLGAFGWLVLRR